MKIKKALIHLLGGRTFDEYNDMSKIAADAMSGWQSTIDVNNEAIELLQQHVEEYKEIYLSTSHKYIKILKFVSDTFGDKNKSKDDIMRCCKKMLTELENED